MEVSVKELASAIAEAITARQDAAPIETGDLVTVGVNDDAELSKRVLCKGCLRGQPFYPGERKVFNKKSTEVHDDDPRGDDGGVVFVIDQNGNLTGDVKPVRKLISYSATSAAKLAGKDGTERCISCGQIRTKAKTFDGRDA